MMLLWKILAQRIFLFLVLLGTPLLIVHWAESVLAVPLIGFTVLLHQEARIRIRTTTKWSVVFLV